MAGKDLKPGDKVEWDSAGGHSTGKVVRKVTATTTLKGHVAKATPDDPQFVVKSDKGGSKAIHKPGSLEHKRR